ncbi:MAG: hypothetical protein ACRDX8_14180 [Acidimicrobiales bacterium]
MIGVLMLVTCMFAVGGIGAVRTISEISTAKDHCFLLADGASRSGADTLSVDTASGVPPDLGEEASAAAAQRWLAVNSTKGMVTTSPQTVSVAVSVHVSTPFGSYTVHSSATAHVNPVAS